VLVRPQQSVRYAGTRYKTLEQLEFSRNTGSVCAKWLVKRYPPQGVVVRRTSQRTHPRQTQPQEPMGRLRCTVPPGAAPRCDNVSGTHWACQDQVRIKMNRGKGHRLLDGAVQRHHLLPDYRERPRKAVVTARNNVVVWATLKVYLLVRAKAVDLCRRHSRGYRLSSFRSTHL